MTPEVKIGQVANLFSRQMHFLNKGDKEAGHSHSFDHLTLLASGSLKVESKDGVKEFVAPHMIYIKKDAQHELTALEDNTVAYCIHPLRHENGAIISPDMVPYTDDQVISMIQRLVNDVS